MADTVQVRAPEEASARVDDGAATRDSRGEWVPRVLQPGQPFVWPPDLKKLLRFLIGFPGFLWPFGAAFYYGLAWLTWRFLQPGAPDLTTFTQLRADWILPMYARNVVMLLVLAGVWHVVLYWRRTQDTRFKYNKRWPSTKSKAFLFNNQTWDNMFWSIVSGATIWTLYEVLLLWAYGHGLLPFADLRANPVWHFAFFLVLPFWQDFHFYVVHRITHWKPLYKAAHYLHHRNTNVGPWSGLSMHPIEHLLYFTRWIILLVVPSHPIHMLYLMQRPAIGPAVGHAGFDQLVLKKASDTRISIDNYFHYLHHRHFECNYGTTGIPFDRWFGSFHDGTPESYERMRRKRRLPSDGATSGGR